MICGIMEVFSVEADPSRAANRGRLPARIIKDECLSSQYRDTEQIHRRAWRESSLLKLALIVVIIDEERSVSILRRVCLSRSALTS